MEDEKTKQEKLYWIDLSEKQCRQNTSPFKIIQVNTGLFFLNFLMVYVVINAIGTLHF